ncbi:MAG: DNA mismatch repair endonuclease MutL [Ruminococcaceae bacterium]|nr:DNA mismatch repair endonuclease MutL [Oscillospiraceae bacterium]
MGKINLLSFEVANLIAAGEVVDRPASAVKELLENAIDSGADKITIEVQRGGVSFIRVADNGCGIEKDDLEAAIKRHSTSKIKNVEDLDSIFTLGFRGEALAAIASVSKLRIFSKVKGQPLGAVLTANGGKVESVIDVGCQDGTTVIVEDLFYNVPARRKFLKKDSTESTAIGAVVEKIALSRSDISFKYISDGEIKFMTSGNCDLSETIWALFGKETAKRSLKVDREENGIRITGFVSEPDLYRSNRNMENFFINGRYIKSKTASAALEQAYSSKIPAEKFPFCVLNIELPPQAVDVNVHPAKLEVKFANEKLIYDAVYYATLSALEAEAKRPELQFPQAAKKSPSSKPSGMTASQLYGAFKPLDERTKKADQIRLSDIVPEIKTINDSTRSSPKLKFEAASTEGKTEAELAEANRRAAENIRRASEYVPSYVTVSDLEAEEAEKARSAERDALIAAEEARLEAERAAISMAENEIPNVRDSYAPVASLPSESAEQTHENTPEPQISINETEDKEEEIYSGEIDPSEIPEYLIIGEAFNCYVLVQIDERLLMIDKHAAHERIIFDELSRKMRANLKNRGDKIGGQLLFSPIEIDVLATEAEAISDYEDKIKALGFDYTIEKKTISTYTASIVQIPEQLERDASIDLFTTLISKLSEVGASVESAAEGFFETRLWQASCKAAIKGGRIYDRAHIKWICDRLLKKPGEDNQVIRTCPHGRPVAFEIKKSAIDRQFARLT